MNNSKTTIPFKKRKLYRELIIKSGLMLSTIPHNMGPKDPGPWTERAMRMAVVYRLCIKFKMTPASARGFIINQVHKKRGVVLSDEVVRGLIRAGSTHWFARYWKWMWHTCVDDMLLHIFCMGLCKDDPERAADKAGIDIHHVNN